MVDRRLGQLEVGMTMLNARTVNDRCGCALGGAASSAQTELAALGCDDDAGTVIRRGGGLK
jgi:hypothetical protein